MQKQAGRSGDVFNHECIVTYLQREWKNIQNSPHARYAPVQIPTPISQSGSAAFVQRSNVTSNISANFGENDTSVNCVKYEVFVTSDDQLGYEPKVENHPDTSENNEYVNNNSRKVVERTPPAMDSSVSTIPESTACSSPMAKKVE